MRSCLVSCSSHPVYCAAPSKPRTNDEKKKILGMYDGYYDDNLMFQVCLKQGRYWFGWFQSSSECDDLVLYAHLHSWGQTLVIQSNKE